MEIDEERSYVDLEWYVAQRTNKNKVWFQSINIMVESEVIFSKKCQANSDRQVNQPLRSSKMPEKAYESLSADFFGPMKNWFVNQCEHSRKTFVHSLNVCSED